MFDKKKYNRDYAARKRIEAKLNGVCPLCGKPVDGEYINCPECRKKISEQARRRREEGKENTSAKIKRNKQRRYKLKAEGRCTECGKIDSYTMNGRSMCYECTEKRNARRRERYKNAENKEAILEYMRQRREKLKELGICTECGKRKAELGHSRCSVCLAKHKNQQAQKRWHSASMRGRDGLCSTCRKNPVKEGYKICESCYQNLCQAGIKGAQRNHEIFVDGRKVDPNFKLPFQKTYDWIFATRRV